MSAIIGFWVGVAVGAGGYWLAVHPDERKALVERVKVLFRKKDAP